MNFSSPLLLRLLLPAAASNWSSLSVNCSLMLRCDVIYPSHAMPQPARVYRPAKASELAFLISFHASNEFGRLSIGRARTSFDVRVFINPRLSRESMKEGRERKRTLRRQVFIERSASRRPVTGWFTFLQQSWKDQRVNERCLLAQTPFQLFVHLSVRENHKSRRKKSERCVHLQPSTN